MDGDDPNLGRSRESIMSQTFELEYYHPIRLVAVFLYISRIFRREYIFL